jgi:hypothetical protein
MANFLRRLAGNLFGARNAAKTATDDGVNRKDPNRLHPTCKLGALHH